MAILKYGAMIKLSITLNMLISLIVSRKSHCFKFKLLMAIQCFLLLHLMVFFILLLSFFIQRVYLNIWT